MCEVISCLSLAIHIGAQPLVPLVAKTELCGFRGEIQRYEHFQSLFANKTLGKTTLLNEDVLHQWGIHPVRGRAEDIRHYLNRQIYEWPYTSEEVNFTSSIR